MRRAPVAQWIRASVFGTEGRRFESVRVYQITYACGSSNHCALLNDMSELDLPPGMSQEDLRFIHPQAFPVSMGARGWSVETYFDVDDNPAKTAILLSRPILEDFTGDDFDNLVARMDIAGEEAGTFKAGYSLRIDSSGELQHTAREMKQAVNPHENNARTLVFHFGGFSTEETMSALEAITATFEERDAANKRGFMRKILGRLGVGSH